MAKISHAEAQRIAGFIAQVADLPTDHVRMKALSELSWIHNRKKADGEKFSALTNRNLIIAYRNAITEKFGENSLLLKYLRYSDARVEEYKAHQVKTRDAKHRDVRPLDADAYVESALLLLGHCVKLRWSTPVAIAALCALTGRRPVEVGLTGTFTPDPGTRHQIIFSGQAKTRDDERVDAPYVIPVLGDRDLILEAIERLRTKVDRSIDNKTFAARYNKEIGIQSKKTFKDVDGESIKPSDLREAYAAVAFYEFAPRRVTEIQYKCDILGHKFMDVTLDYLGFSIEQN